MTMGIIAVRHVMLDDEEDKKKKPMNPIWLFIAVPGRKNWPSFSFFVIPKGEFMVNQHLYLPSSTGRWICIRCRCTAMVTHGDGLTITAMLQTCLFLLFACVFGGKMSMHITARMASIIWIHIDWYNVICIYIYVDIYIRTCIYILITAYIYMRDHGHFDRIPEVSKAPYGVTFCKSSSLVEGERLGEQKCERTATDPKNLKQNLSTTSSPSCRWNWIPTPFWIPKWTYLANLWPKKVCVRYLSRVSI